MPSLKDLKVRIKSVKSTQKITKAMKMVAAAKLRRAKEAAENARPYAEAMEHMIASLAASQRDTSTNPFLVGTGKQDKILLVVATGDRGLCGAFNSSIVRSARRKARELVAQGKQVKLLYVGRKGRDMMRLEFQPYFAGDFDLPKKKVTFADAEPVALLIREWFAAGEFDVCHIVYNKFKSAIAQEVTWQQLIPLSSEWRVASGEKPSNDTLTTHHSSLATSYDYEPSEEDILAELLPKNLSVQVYRALLENAASEQGARMTAMDNATRNAGDMIKKLNLKYNRTRQAAITKELIEIISGAEAV
ncbi:MAG: F0F1 ATP synthase subunit gamma [Alphaproteobacteria bacterium]|nr:F0F1 ATP synthase subunit gamma [Alphaproteobacteria bacterium]